MKETHVPKRLFKRSHENDRCQKPVKFELQKHRLKIVNYVTLNWRPLFVLLRIDFISACDVDFNKNTNAISRRSSREKNEGAAVLLCQIAELPFNWIKMCAILRTAMRIENDFQDRDQIDKKTNIRIRFQRPDGQHRISSAKAKFAAAHKAVK